MRGLDAFPDLWRRRTTFDFGDETVDALSLPDLIAAKKTQRDKDWPMIRRLVDVHYTTYRRNRRSCGDAIDRGTGQDPASAS